MLTDYHMHLRPDDTEATAERYFTERNVARYLEAAAERGVSDIGFSEHVHRFRQALDVWRHPFWEENAVDDLDEYVDFVLRVRDAGHPVKLGIEMDFVPGREEQIAALLEGRPWDYVIGSVHFIADRAVDHEGYDAWRTSAPDEVWTEYFSALGDAAASGLFDVLAHPDLVKVWGAGRAAPTRPPRVFYELALEGICAADVSIEVSTAGLRKPVGEIYPVVGAAGHAGRRGQAGHAVLGRPRARAPRLRLRPGAGVPRLGRGGSDLRLGAPPAHEEPVG